MEQYVNSYKIANIIIKSVNEKTVRTVSVAWLDCWNHVENDALFTV